MRKLILSFPPPDPRPNKNSLLRSLSGNNLIRSDTVTKRFNTLLQNATALIFVDSLNTELGVCETQSILTHQHERLFYTRDRRRLLPESLQKAVYQSVKAGLFDAGVELDKVAAANDITLATLERILSAQDANLTLEHLANGRSYDKRALDQLSTELLDLIKTTRNLVVLAATFTQVPVAWLESTVKTLISVQSNHITGLVETRHGEICFIPQSLLVQHKDELNQALDAYTQESLDELLQTGYCEITAASRPEILQQTPHQDLAQLIRQSAAQREATTSEIVQLSTPASNEATTTHTFLILQPTLDTKTSQLVQKAATAASSQWHNRRHAEEITYSPSTLQNSLNINASSLDSAILHHPNSSTIIKSTYESQLVTLQNQTSALLIKTLQTQIFGPLKLYTTGTSSINDTTLRARLESFIYDHTRTFLLPSVLSTLKSKNLFFTSKSAQKDLDKFIQTISSFAKNLSDINAAAAKLARKVKIEALTVDELMRLKVGLLEEKVQGLNKMKRASDLLQNVVWILLATVVVVDHDHDYGDGEKEEKEDEEDGEKKEDGEEKEDGEKKDDKEEEEKKVGGLFMSSGKDTSRMIKLVKERRGQGGGRYQQEQQEEKEEAEKDIGLKLEQWKDMLKQGNETEHIKKEMRDLAANSLERFKAASVKKSQRG
jgi:hypothetical protein